MKKKTNNSKDQTMDNFIGYYLNNKESTSENKFNELEFRFGTRSHSKKILKPDFDNVVKKLRSMNFTTNDNGEYLLRMNNEFVSREGKVIISNIRTEIEGFEVIRKYCQVENLQTLLNNELYNKYVRFNKKEYAKTPEGDQIRPFDVDDFQFRITYQTEETITSPSIIDNIVQSWEGTRKMFRYIKRYRFVHNDLPIYCDLSIVKSSKKQQQRPYHPIMTYTMEESNVFHENETYEIEIELDESKLDDYTHDEIIKKTKQAVKYILCGLQETNYPVSYNDMDGILEEYMTMIHGPNEKHYMRRVYPKHFIGPSTYTLQYENIQPLENDKTIPNIRNQYTVTDKADGSRALLYVCKKGKLYFIDSNMKVQFTGCVTKEKRLFQSLVDGEFITHNKAGTFINLFALFDLYYINGESKRHLKFVEYDVVTTTETEKKTKPKSSRILELRKFVSFLQAESITNSAYPLRIEMKHFEISKDTDDIFSLCKKMMKRINDVSYEYITDGLVFTPAQESLPKTKNRVTWEYSFKWKPPQYNTIDFLVNTVKDETTQDIVQTEYGKGGILSSIKKYKTLHLSCGYNRKMHGFVNPCESVFQNESIPSIDKTEFNNVPMLFYPTTPYDERAHICNIEVREDELGRLQMMCEEDDVIDDNTIVEFKYVSENEKDWKWVPLRVRYDKTAQLRSGVKNFGNAYHVANSNWKTIHNPITEQMLSTGKNISSQSLDDDVYYNRMKGETHTRSLRDYHNLVVKKHLIDTVAQPGNTLIDFAVGKAGDFPKWINSRLSFIYGIDFSRDNIENQINGACVRYLKKKSEYRNIPYTVFLHGDSSKNIRNGEAIFSERHKSINNAIFGEGPKDKTALGNGIYNVYGKGHDGFQISSCQFAIHYFFENPFKLKQFIENVSTCTLVGGYFIGTCYNGSEVFEKLIKKKKGESVSLFDGSHKLWEIVKEYDTEKFNADASSIGLAVDVYQESINQYIREYLVHFPYFIQLMNDYGFELYDSNEKKRTLVKKGLSSFRAIFQQMKNAVDNGEIKEKDIGKANDMSDSEKEISFLNSAFIFKKIRNVNVKDVIFDMTLYHSTKEDEEEITPEDGKNEYKLKIKNRNRRVKLRILE